MTGCYEANYPTASGSHNLGSGRGRLLTVQSEAMPIRPTRDSVTLDVRTIHPRGLMAPGRFVGLGLACGVAFLSLQSFPSMPFDQFP